jgi:hypothetical protein
VGSYSTCNIFTVEGIKSSRALPIKNYAMKTCEGVVVEIHVFFTSALVGGECSASRPTRFTLEETSPCSHWLGGGAGPRAGLEGGDNRKILFL